MTTLPGTTATTATTPPRGLLCPNVDYVLMCWNGYTLPDCVEIMICPGRSKSTDKEIAWQETIFRDVGERDFNFWIRLQVIAREMVGTDPKRGTHVIFTCKYNTTLCEESARAYDADQNYRRLLRYQMQYAPTMEQRCNAALEASYLVWPAEKARGTVQ